MNEKETFEYTYSASEHAEIIKIRSKYEAKQPQTADTVEALRRLDRQTYTPGMVAALVFGSLGLLAFGLGLSMVTVWQETLFIAGILVGLAGLALMAIAYPVCKRVTKKQKAKNAPQILALSDRLLQENASDE